MASVKIGWPKAFPKGEYDLPWLVGSSGSAALVALHMTGAAMTRVSKEDAKGTAVPLVAPTATPGLVRGLASTREGTFVLHPNDKRIVLCDERGAARATFTAPYLRQVVAFVAHPTRPEVAFVWDEAEVGVATTARLYRLTAEDMLAGREPTLLDTRPFRPTIAYDSAGALVAVDSGIIHVFAEGSTTSATVSIQTKLSGPQARMTAAGDRLALQMAPTGGSLLIVDRQGNVLREYSGLIAENFQLVEGGRTLALTAQSAKARTGSADWVQWPEPRMLESYVAFLDVDSGDVRGLASRSAGITQAFVAIEGECLAVASYGRSKKIELISWAALAG
jgi:hypothetical protein